MALNQPIRILHVEDLQADADIVRRVLTKGGLNFELHWVKTKQEYQKSLGEIAWDIVISDHSIPGFGSEEAFQMLQATSHSIPFILVTSTVSEEFAVKMMHEGIADYLLKDRLQRLPAAVMNAIERAQAEKERHRSLQLLIQNEKRFRGLIENSHDMIIVTDEHFQPVFASSSYSRITGRMLQPRQTQSIDFVHPEDRKDYYYLTLDRVVREPGVYFPISFRLKHSDGHYIWVEGTVVNMLREQSIAGIIFNLRDATARRTAEESLRKSQAHIRSLIENSNVVIYSIDRDFRYLSFNTHLKKQVKQVYGIDVRVGDQVFQFLEKLAPQEVVDWRKIYSDAFKGQSLEFERETRFGKIHAFTAFSINPIIEGHQVTGLSCFAWDITPQKEATLKVSRSEARFRALIENNFDAIIVRDEHLKITYASPSACRMLGYSPAEWGTDPIVVEVHPDDEDYQQRMHLHALQNPGMASPIQMRVKRRIGDFIWIEGLITNMLNNESVQGLVSNFHDVTERKEAEIQREQMTQDLIERNQNLEQYAYIVSHNLRAPVANILGISNLLELGGVTQKDMQSSLTHLFNSARRLDEVIRDLNLILQMQQGIHEKNEVIYFEELVRDVSATAMAMLPEGTCEIQTDFSGYPAITTVKSYLYSIFYNLMSNSIKYKKPDVPCLVKIQSRKFGDRCIVTVSDNGMGIDLESQGSKVFGLYKRFHPDHAEGKGMGLFMTKTQVEALGGRISIKSEVGQGTEFTILM